MSFHEFCKNCGTEISSSNVNQERRVRYETRCDGCAEVFKEPRDSIQITISGIGAPYQHQVLACDDCAKSGKAILMVMERVREFQKVKP